MHFQITATSGCPGDDCPELQIDSTTGDVYVRGYSLTGEQAAGATKAGGPLPSREGRLRIPGAVFDHLVAQHQAR